MIRSSRTMHRTRSVLNLILHPHRNLAPKRAVQGLPISPTMCPPLHAAITGVGVAGNWVDVEELPGDSKYRFSSAKSTV